ncbi:hypothetical protein [Sphingomonas sp. UYP23]
MTNTPEAAPMREDVTQRRPNLIIERDYWRDPVQVFAGAAWLVIGIVLGVLFS